MPSFIPIAGFLCWSVYFLTGLDLFVHYPLLSYLFLFLCLLLSVSEFATFLVFVSVSILVIVKIEEKRPKSYKYTVRVSGKLKKPTQDMHTDIPSMSI